MSMYKASGEENLRADESVKASDAIKGTPGQISIDTPPNLQKFDDHGHKKDQTQTFDGPDKALPTNYSHDVPHGLQSFDDNGQKDGGTQYLGR